MLKVLKCREQSCGDFSPHQMVWQGEEMQFRGFGINRAVSTEAVVSPGAESKTHSALNCVSV